MKFKLSVIISILMILISCSEENTANQVIENKVINEKNVPGVVVPLITFEPP